MYGMRFEVPQFIEIEDKIFGPFTWKQFVYLGGGVGIGVVTFLTLPIFFFALIGLPLAALGFALAFWPVNNRPFSIFLESIFRFYSNSQVYHWKKKSDVVYKGAPSQFAPTTLPGTPDVQKPSDSIYSLSRRLELNALQKEDTN